MSLYIVDLMPANFVSFFQPNRSSVLNVDFIRDDGEDPLVFLKKFDYVYLRIVVS
ncbi:hypothetical protein BJ878DRAFT_543885 [Calycina marina]|uniref:Uncharacterized protein n=1 Tax=Calycina marina TaxID=1763456 RepID=A0A9P7Z0F9_9HELO|nr:hypothetical protein BJ878DRAFT_543885 [Calycina marina]